MKRNQKIALGAVVATLSAITFFGANMASATAGEETLVGRIASRFSLNSTEVQAVFDEHHTEERAERSAQRSADLQAKVDDGTITAEQKTLIEAKLAEKEAERDALRDQGLTRDEMRAQMQTSRESLEQWATDNGIDLSLVMPMGKHGGERGGRGGEGFGGHFGENETTNS